MRRNILLESSELKGRVKRERERHVHGLIQSAELLIYSKEQWNALKGRDYTHGKSRNPEDSSGGRARTITLFKHK